MSEKKWELNRRAFLKGAGVAMALPALEAMMPSILREAQAAGTTPASNLKMLNCYFPNGQAMGDWAARAWDATNGGYGQRSGGKVVPQHTRDILNGVWSDVNVLSNLQSRAHGKHDTEVKPVYCPSSPEGCGDAHGGSHVPNYSCSASQYISHGDWYIKETFDYAIRNDAFGGRATELLGIAGSLDGGVDSYHSTRHSNCISWNQGVGLDFMLNPRAFFNKIAGVTGVTPVAGGGSASDIVRIQGSVVDAVKEHIDHIKRKGLGKADMETLNNYVDSLNQSEANLNAMDGGTGTTTSGGTCSLVQPVDYSTIRPDQYLARFNIWKKLVVNAFQCNKTHLITFMFGTEDTNVGFVPGVPGGSWHRHFDGNNFYYANLVQMWTYQQYRDIITDMKNTKDYDGNSLLHNSLCILFTDVGPSNGHTGDLQMVMAGQLGGKLKTGQGELRGGTNTIESFSGYPDKPINMQQYDIADVFYTVLKGFGSTRSQFGDYGKTLVKEIWNG